MVSGTVNAEYPGMDIINPQGLCLFPCPAAYLQLVLSVFRDRMTQNLLPHNAVHDAVLGLGPAKKKPGASQTGRRVEGIQGIPDVPGLDMRVLAVGAPGPLPAQVKPQFCHPFGGRMGF